MSVDGSASGVVDETSQVQGSRPRERHLVLAHAYQAHHRPSTSISTPLSKRNRNALPHASRRSKPNSRRSTSDSAVSTPTSTRPHQLRRKSPDPRKARDTRAASSSPPCSRPSPSILKG